MCDALLDKIGDERLRRVAGCIHHHNTDNFLSICKDLIEYDKTFLWIICFAHEGNKRIGEYINANYEKNRQILDSGFLSKLVSNGNFDARMWEMVLCDTLSSIGSLIPKGESGADFLLSLPNGNTIQIEAVTINEADDVSQRSHRPVYGPDNMAELSGNIEDLERPVLLRFIKGFDDKEKKYSRDVPLIIAINTSKAVGFVSDDNYILRRNLFGLGYVSITKNGEGYVTGLQQNPLLTKPTRSPFAVGRFRDEKYKHVSGVIYTSQVPHSLTPAGHGWQNHGITYVANPLASNPVKAVFPSFRELRCTEERYEEIDASEHFKTTIPTGS